MSAEAVKNYKFTDIHCHILPGVDDGSKNMEMSLAMARGMAANNIDTVIVTPHYNGARRSASPDGIRRRVEELQAVCDDEGLGLTFYPGNELLYDRSLPERLSRGEVLTLADSPYCLVEFHPMDDYHYIYDALRSLQYEGYRPILAHCERYACLTKDKKRVDDIVSQNVLLQCNAASVEQKLFQSIPKFVNGLLRRGLVSFIASDSHRPEGDRAPNLLPAAAWLSKKYEADYVRRLLHDNASRIIG